MGRILKKHKTRLLILAVLILVGGFSGCNNDTPTNTTKSNNLSFSASDSRDSTGDKQTIFIIDTAKILIKDIKLNVANNNEDSTEFKVGPFVLFLNLTSNVNEISSGIIPEGTYEKIKFEIHKLNDMEAIPDPEFADSNGRYSVVVKGWYYGNYFVYKSTKSAHQILQFPNSYPIVSSNNTNITLTTKPYIWFMKNGFWLDPRDPMNSNDIDNNIKDNINQNFRAFRDNDRNGIPD